MVHLNRHNTNSSIILSNRFGETVLNVVTIVTVYYSIYLSLPCCITFYEDSLKRLFYCKAVHYSPNSQTKHTL